ncbi:acetolactate synthase small subunit [Mangrovibacterium lignilyticum]|uniref:acetolactate synthase small subunit n=1 Tax=Mangrovibacterium lignilyticum TaxID=2668052 RepID=UPI0013D30751|nr:acetolactate synthase small subunit [Mangrovibacterium lignilyticum]
MKQEFIITVYSENHIGLLNRITINFTRRKINIESLTVSASAIQGISKFTIVVNETEDRVKKVVSQLEKVVDVLKAFYHTNEEMVYQELALYKVQTESLYESDQIEQLVRKSGARILEITREFTVIEKTGHKTETQKMFDDLSQFGVLQFIRSGRIAITRDPIERLSEFLKERDALLESMD